MDEDLHPEQTPGFKLGDKKTLDEYKNLDANDESLNRWKASLGLDKAEGSGAHGKVIVKTLSLVVAGRPDIVIDVTKPEVMQALKEKPLVIKEGIEYEMRADFIVEGQVISGLRYLQVTKRAGIKVDKMDEMVGSFAPNTPENPHYTKKFPKEEAPSGMLARSGSYNARSRFVDDDGIVFLDFEWTFKIGKDWA